MSVRSILPQHLFKGSYSSASVVTLSGILLSILINLKGPFPLLQEQQLIKWLISDGRVWMFWVNFIDLRAGPEGPERKPASHLRVGFWGVGGGGVGRVDLHLGHLKTPLKPKRSADPHSLLLMLAENPCGRAWLSPEMPRKTDILSLTYINTSLLPRTALMHSSPSSCLVCFRPLENSALCGGGVATIQNKF